MPSPSIVYRLTVIAVLLSALLLVTACGGGDPEPEASLCPAPVPAAPGTKAIPAAPCAAASV